MDNAETLGQIQGPRKKQPTILEWMIIIVILAICFGVVATILRENAQSERINHGFFAFLKQFKADHPSLVLDSWTFSHQRGLTQAKFKYRIEFNTAKNHVLRCDIVCESQTLRRKDTSIVTVTCNGKIVTYPFQDLAQLKLDLKADFPDVFP